MNNIVQFLFLLIFSWAHLTFAQVPLDGLVAFYPFNGNAEDSTINNLDGVVNGALLIDDRCGNSLSAYQFDGVDDNILISDDILLRPFQISISFWAMQSELNSDWQALIAKINSNQVSNFNYIIATKASVPIHSAFNKSTNCQNGDEVIRNNADLNWQLDQWQHICVTYDGIAEKFYWNGTLIKDTTFIAPIDNCEGSNLSIGGTLYETANQYFKGSIDDIRIYNRALSIEEVESIYDWERCQDEPRLIAYYPFDGNANDESGNELDGVVNGAVLTANRCGQSNTAYSFDGIDDNIFINDDPKLRPSKITISLWAKQFDFDEEWRTLVAKIEPNQVFNNNYIIATRSENPIHAAINKGTNCFSSDDVIRTSNPFSWELNNWEHICVTFDGEILRFYQNGLSVDTMIYAINADMNICADAPLTIGGTFYNNLNQHFKGEIDDVRLYNYAFTPQEVVDLFNLENCITNVNDIENELPIVFPNPTNGVVHLSRMVDILIVKDIFGRKLLTTTFTDKVNLAHLPNGAYFLIYRFNDIEFTSKILLNVDK